MQARILLHSQNRTVHYRTSLALTSLWLDKDIADKYMKAVFHPGSTDTSSKSRVCTTAGEEHSLEHNLKVAEIT